MTFQWLESADHGFRPLKASGRTTEDVLAESVYIVDTHGDEPKIVFYLANQDLMEVLRERGILVA